MEGIYRQGKIIYKSPQYIGLYKSEETFKPKYYGGETISYEISENIDKEHLIENESYNFSILEGKAIIEEY
jgi:hypothetical protein